MGFFGEAFADGGWQGFRFTKGFFDGCLRGEAGMVGAWQPQDFVALKPGATAKDVLDSVVENVAECEDASDIGRWNHDRVFGFGRCRLRVVEAGVHPARIKFLLDWCRIVGFGEFWHERKSVASNV